MIYMFLAEGFEEVEALSPLDILRRGGVDVKTVGIGGREIRGSHGIPVVCDLADSEYDASGFSGVILPGGMPGTNGLDASAAVDSAVRRAASEYLPLCAICAAPSVLGKRGLLAGKHAVCFPGFEKYLTGATVTRARVERDGNIVTAVGMGAAVEFGLCILSLIKGEEAGEKMRRAILAPAAVNVL